MTAPRGEYRIGGKRFTTTKERSNHGCRMAHEDPIERSLSRAVVAEETDRDLSKLFDHVQATISPKDSSRTLFYIDTRQIRGKAELDR